METVGDIYKFNRWVQRTWINGEYTWTESGVMWNGIKRRTNDKLNTLHQNNKYVGAENKFESFDVFVEWVRGQTGYGLKYDLDSDILKPDGSNKVYSKDTCLLIPSGLNRFLQRSKVSKIGLQGVCFDTKRNAYLTQCHFEDDVSGELVVDVCKYFKNLDDAKSLYAKTKSMCGQIWLERLVSDQYAVDERVVSYMQEWEFKYD